MAAWLFRPDGADGDVPCVVLLHGFTATHDDCHLEAFCEAFAAAGIAALAFDYRHFGSSGGEPRQLIDFAHQYEDCDAALRFVRDRQGIDAARIAIWGTSFAGGYALDAAVRNPWVAAAICLVPFMDGRPPPPGMTLRRMAWSMAVGLRDAARGWRGREPYLVRALGPSGTRAVLSNDAVWKLVPSLIPPHSRWRNEVAARIVLSVPRHHPVTRAARVRCPMLVQIAADETLLRNAPAEKAARRATRGELRRYAGADHCDVYLPPVFDSVVEDEIAFLQKHLVEPRKAEVAAATP